MLAAIVLLLAPSAALATNQAAHYWNTTSDQNWKGTRVTVDNPSGSEMNVVSGDFAHSTAYADAAPVNSLIQQGVHWRNHDPYPGGGTCTENVLAYFVEIIHAGAASCYTEGTASTSVNHIMEVLRGSAGNWRPYMDNQWQAGVQTSWDPCGGDACTLAAFGEEGTGSANTFWHAKFAGPSGQTKWQFWNGTLWNTINNCSTVLDPGWAGSGPFPGGIWSFIYRDGGNNPYPC